MNICVFLSAAEEMVITADLAERKATLLARSDALVVMAGEATTPSRLAHIPEALRRRSGGPVRIEALIGFPTRPNQIGPRRTTLE